MSVRSVVSGVKRFLALCAEGIVEMIIPDVCRVCGSSLLSNERGVCKVCAGRLESTSFETVRDNPMMVRLQDRVPIQSAFAAYYYRDGHKLRELVHDFKYHGMFPIAEMLGHEIGVRALRSGFAAEYDVLIPVPVHPKREMERGYNQCYHVCKGMAKATNLELRTDVLIRMRFDGSQTKLSAQSRMSNVKGGFALTATAATSMAGKRLLLVDDVFTTGATAEACLTELAKIPGVRLGMATVGYRVRD